MSKMETVPDASIVANSFLLLAAICIRGSFTVPSLLIFRPGPSLKLGLDEFALKDVRKSHKHAFISFVVANIGCDDEAFQLMLVIRSEEDNVGSIVRRPTKGLRLCPVASQFITPFPRAAANKSESLVCG
jgi:hypothetical protein